MPATRGTDIQGSAARHKVGIPALHADDLENAAYLVHLDPTAAEGEAMVMGAGGAYVATDVLTPTEHTAIANGAPHHAPVTLAADHGLALTGQQMAMGTPSTLTAATTNAVSTTTHTHAVTGFAVPGDLHPALTLGANPGLSLSTQELVLGTPSTLTVSTTNAVTGANHAHAITSSANPGAAASILASAPTTGYLQLTRLGLGVSPTAALLQLAAGSASAGTGPVMFTSGTLLTTPEVGVLEFLADTFYGTITTGAARKEFMQWGKLPAAASGISFIIAPNERALNTTPSVFPDNLSIYMSDTQTGAPGNYGLVETVKCGTAAFQWWYPYLFTGAAQPAYKPYFRLGDYNANTWGAWNSLVAVDSTGTIVMPTDTSIGQLAGVLITFDVSHGVFQVDGGSILVGNGGVSTPFGGLGLASNLIPYSESTSLWSYTDGVTLTGNTADTDAPNGTVTATKMVMGASSVAIYWNGPNKTEAEPYTLSLWMKGASGGEVIAYGLGDGYTASATLTTAWRRYLFTVASHHAAQLDRLIQLNSASAATIYVWGAQLENSVNPGVYVRTGATNSATVRHGGIVDGQLQVMGTIGFTDTPTARLHLPAGSAAASTAPMKLTSGTSLTTAEAGAIEFTTDDFFATITTGAARKAFVLDDGARLTATRVPFATTNGRLTDDADLTFATDTLSATKVAASGGVTTQAVDFTASTPDALTGDVNNWDLGNNTFIRASGGAADRIVTGIVARASGHLLIFQNIGTTNKITFANESASSTAGNRLINANAGSTEITPNHCIMYIYDATTARWREITHL